MNKTDLEKMFDETFGDLGKVDVYNEEGEPIYYRNNNDEVKEFIFKTIIPEILKSIMPKYIPRREDGCFTIYNIKQKAKELYGIDL